MLFRVKRAGTRYNIGSYRFEDTCTGGARGTHTQVLYNRLVQGSKNIPGEPGHDTRVQGHGYRTVLGSVYGTVPVRA